MPVVSVTRLRIRSWRFMPSFGLYTLRATRQAQRTPGFIGGWVGSSGHRAFWTVTVWRDEAAMRSYRDRAVHKAAMPRMLDWGDEAAMARYEQTGTESPNAAAALTDLASRGRTSKVRHPSEAHAAGKTVPDGRVPRVGRVLAPV